MILAPEQVLEDLLQKRERAAIQQTLTLMTASLLDRIADHAFVVKRWHRFSLRINEYLQKLPEGEEADRLKEEFYRLVGDIDESLDVPPPEKPRAVIVRHVKWKGIGESIFPTAMTATFGKLPGLARGTLIFIPEEEDYDEEPDEFSSTRGFAGAAGP